MTWTKVAEKGDIQTGKSKEFEVDGKKLQFLIKMDIMHWMEYANTKMGQ